MIDIGVPTTFLDSHPTEQNTSYVVAGLSFLRGQLYTAWTGIVPKPLLAGSLRIIWYTDKGKEGMKDYELHQATLVRENYEMLCSHPDVRRVLVMGYSGQNPWVLNSKGLESELRKMKNEARRARAAQDKIEGKGRGLAKGQRAVVGNGESESGAVAGPGPQMGTLLDIEDVIEQTDREEEQKRKMEEERTWKENEGLLSGEMV
ncbi:hypothetical protein LOCC1_G001215 [Lachnellula occidentalis]|uniref:Uncharacterized protein n=1 Tax=Lachnellula occidentalis TaxID=215460 RepID=A0A8H8S6B8_9HELO|nr:hypothetical protein LOCC1_G001215 [Lachnellula occidentalis]